MPLSHPRRTPLLRTLFLTGLLLGTLNAHAQTAAPEAPPEKFLGNILGAESDPDFATLWNQVTPENAGKWASVGAQRGTMTWTVLDGIFAYARAHDLPVKQHTFIWG